MSAAKLDLTVDKGSTFNPVFTCENPDGTPIDLTGYAARMQMREDIDSEDTIVSLTVGSGITLGGVLGTITPLISATDTSAITQDGGVWDLELVYPDAVTVVRLLYGKVKFTPEVTR